MYAIFDLGHFLDFIEFYRIPLLKHRLCLSHFGGNFSGGHFAWLRLSSRGQRAWSFRMW